MRSFLMVVGALTVASWALFGLLAGLFLLADWVHGRGCCRLSDADLTALLDGEDVS